jgi:tetrahydromethanopterin S-methyltransferase subunit A
MLEALVGRPEIAVAGRVFTENIGIEMMLGSLAANPHMTVLIVCGRETDHRVGETIVALHANGVDDNRRVIGSSAPEPVLPNVSAAVLDHFRRGVQIIDMIDTTDADAVLRSAGSIRGDARAAGPVTNVPIPEILAVPANDDRWEPDPIGYYLISVDLDRNMIVLDHHGHDHRLLHRIVGATATALCATLDRHAMVTNIPHALYLGREIARAEIALRARSPYRQDVPPDPPPHG